MRLRLKCFAERALVASGFAAAGRARLHGDVLVLAYHNVVADDAPAAGDRSLHLAQDAFTRQLDLIERNHDVVPLTTVLQSAPPRRRPRVVITFDDAYVGALTIAVPELTRRGMPATIFVAPGLLGQRAWWDVLADPGAGAVHENVRQRALTEFEGNGSSILQWAASNSAPMDGATPRIGTEGELAVAASQPGIAVASHSWSHPNLSVIAPGLLERELLTSMSWLRERFTNFAPWIAYPYGLHSPDVERVAKRLGYLGAVRVAGGWTRPSAVENVHAIPRYNVPAGLSIDGFRLRLGGIGTGTNPTTPSQR